MTKQNLRMDEAAQFLCISPSKLFKMCSLRQVGYSKVGRVNVFKLSDLVALLEENRVKSTHELQEQAETNFVNSRQLKLQHYG